MNKFNFKAVRKSDGLESFSNFDLLSCIKGSNHCAGSIDVDGFFSFDLSSTPDIDEIEICQSIAKTDYLNNEIFENDLILFNMYQDKIFIVLDTDVYNFGRTLLQCRKDSSYQISISEYELKSQCLKVGNKWLKDEDLLENIKRLSVSKDDK